MQFEGWTILQIKKEYIHKLKNIFLSQFSNFLPRLWKIHFLRALV